MNAQKVMTLINKYDKLFTNKTNVFMLLRYMNISVSTKFTSLHLFYSVGYELLFSWAFNINVTTLCFNPLLSLVKSTF